MEKVILITGASSGFGKEAAKALLGKGHTVYAAARNVAKMEDLRTMGAHILKMDVTSDAEVEAGVRGLIAREGRIDVLFNNAGFGSFGLVESVPVADIRYQFDVNVFGAARMVQAVLPFMRQQRSGRIINTSSVVGKVSMPCSGYYSATKYAVESFSDALRMEVRQFGIRVSILEPGPVKTGFESVVNENLAKREVPDDYRSLSDHFKRAFAGLYAQAPGPESTVRCVLHAVESRRPRLRYKTTGMSRAFIFARSVLPSRWMDALMRVGIEQIKEGRS